MKYCPLCRSEKPHEAFYADRRRRNGLHTYCRDCCKVRAKGRYALNPKAHADRHRRWVAANRDRVAAHKAKSAYGISGAELAALLPVCVICGSREQLGIDHSHQSRRVRGRLCNACNKGLGFFKDDPSLLLRASDYVLGVAKPEIFAATYEAVDL